MTRALYFDCFAGASGDMIIGALLDLGLELDALNKNLASLKLSGYEIKAGRVKRSGIAAVKFDVQVDESSQPGRYLSDIKKIIQQSTLSEKSKAASTGIFELLAQAEARVHGTTADLVHFHEVGAVDSIIDIVGACIGFELLGIEQFISSPLRIGRGFVHAEHGLMPVPAPGTAEILRGVPVYAGDIDGEFVTPTGAAIVASYCESFEPLPRMSIEQVGYGAGARNPAGFPNALRLILGEISADDTAPVDDAELSVETSVVVIETNIDDMNPQAYGFVMDRAFALGAKDVYLTPVQMKKGRPGTQLSVICDAEEMETITAMLLQETTTLGLRYYEAKRRVLDRDIETVETEYGPARIKVAREQGRTLHFQPEYEDCVRLARESGAPLIEVQAAAISAYRKRLGSDAEENGIHGKLE